MTPSLSDLTQTNQVAVFFDFENIKRSVDDYFSNERVDLKRILDEVARITNGRIIMKRAYADWSAFKDYRSDLLENATEPIQAFSLTHKGKNGSDIRLAIDVIEVVLRHPDITHITIVSGDSDFTPLVMKVRELGRYVVGVGARSNSSNYLAKAVDLFVYYDDIHRDTVERTTAATTAEPGLTQGERYRQWLRDNNFRYVPYEERQLIIEILFDIFQEAAEDGGDISLKEAKDELHAWFEENRPAVPWDSINSTVYHLFYTWCFAFDKSDEGKQLWDRATALQSDIHTAEELQLKAERGIVRKLWERDRSELDAGALNEWLYDGNPTMLPRIQELIESIPQPSFAGAGRSY